ncbi:MAG: class I SAM-dependent methyltransferase, partial [Candidatus Dormibacteraeota bacterium]|nr:class I SAM-dependent methyltransferase [Candidatus Dormibacteraeota bacterium]
MPWSHQAARSHRTRERWVEEYQSGEWERLHTLQEFGRYSLIAGYVRRLGSGLRILDVGCGNGPLMEELRPLGNTYVGCDLAPPAIQRALESAGSNELLLVADAEKLPFGPGSFDVVVCNEVLN